MSASPSSTGTSSKAKSIKKRRKYARMHPAYEAHEGFISRFLGLDQFALGDKKRGIASIATVTLGICCFLVVAFEPRLLGSDDKTCCYPEGAPKLNQLGSCTDENAIVHDHPRKQSCPILSALGIGLLCGGILSFIINYIFIHAVSPFSQRLGRRPDFGVTTRPSAWSLIICAHCSGKGNLSKKQR